MSQAVVEQVVGKLVVDSTFRALAKADLQQALMGFDLTLEERNSFQGIDLDEFDQAVTGLDARVSKGILGN